MADSIHVLGIAGSLRKGSLNRAALRAAGELLPESMTLETFDLAPIPMFNGDVEAAGMPVPVRKFRERIAAADALLLVSPEYNNSMPAVLKNAIDWASRPPENAFEGKPAAIMGASPGAFGTILGQDHLRRVCRVVDLIVMNYPEVYITRAGDKFDAEGKLTDETVRRRIRTLLAALADWTRRLK
jgi:chromate reductase, NAD(P)H dehydrogenase (quinone)